MLNSVAVAEVKEKPQEYPFALKLMLLYLLNVADWLCTQVLIDTGYFREVNPIMIWIMDYPSLGFAAKCIVPLVLLGIIIWSFNYFQLEQNLFTNIVIYTGVVIYSIVIFIHIINFLLLFTVV